MPFAVQATGHGTHVACTGGLLLKTTNMASVLVDPDRRIARAGPGVRWKDVITAAVGCGLAPLSGSSPSVGVVGYTLGGGMGWLARAYGVAADSVLRAEIVDADGQLLTASREVRPDLFWALRGGGSNFGVVTALEFRLYPVTTVYRGISYFPAERAADILGYCGWTSRVPDEMSTAVLLPGYLQRPPSLSSCAAAEPSVSRSSTQVRPARRIGSSGRCGTSLECRCWTGSTRCRTRTPPWAALPRPTSTC